MAFAQAEAPSVSEMNVTPLIDVMMVLLVIFMVTAPMIERVLPLDLPQAAPGAVPPDPLTLRIEVDGYRWNGAPLPAAALPATLAVEAARSPQPVVQLETGDRVAYGEVARVLALARDAGIAGIGMPTD